MNQGSKFFPKWKKDCALATPINSDGFHGLRIKKFGSKVGEKSASLPVFLPLFSFPFSAVPATNRHHLLLVHHHFPHKPPAQVISTLGIITLTFLSPPPVFLLSPAPTTVNRHASSSMNDFHQLRVDLPDQQLLLLLILLLILLLLLLLLFFFRFHCFWTVEREI